jgi:hypothetical protein
MYDGKHYDAYATGDTAWVYCNKLQVDGITGWRLPSIKELETIMSTQEKNPAIDPIFQHTVSGTYWSFTEEYDDTRVAWLVDFTDGYTNGNTKDVSRYVRCVKGAELEEFSSSSSGTTLEDPLTHLQWQDDDAVETNKRTWENAIKYCEDLGLGNHEDWRLPNIIELQSISKRETTFSYFGFNHHPKRFEGDYALIWSSTSAVNIGGPRSQAWGVVGDFGSAAQGDKSNGDEYYIRCVRDNVHSPDAYRMIPIMTTYLLN